MIDQWILGDKNKNIHKAMVLKKQKHLRAWHVYQRTNNHRRKEAYFNNVENSVMRLHKRARFNSQSVIWHMATKHIKHIYN